MGDLHDHHGQSYAAAISGPQVESSHATDEQSLPYVRSTETTSGVDFRNANASPLADPRFRFDDDLDVLTKCSQQAHEARAREVSETPIEQRRDLRLINPHEQPRCVALTLGLCVSAAFLWV